MAWKFYTSEGMLKVDNTAAVKKATLTTKGDLYAATAASTPARLGVGANDTVLTAASGETTGMKWAAATGGSSEEAEAMAFFFGG